ncbi:MAG: helix-turn-helix domain-containing protein [Oscillospiraceae bacterium]|nr:helix-turn-helix domain-containing protein [Oscillospiraceae bacterium]
MFLDNLSASVLRLCNANHLSYESASELCCLSSRYFGDIARGKTSPTILTLEKLCIGFGCTPNELLIHPSDHVQTSFRVPMLVTHVRCYKGSNGLFEFPVCPRCAITLEREYQAYCDRCGQRLDWSCLHKASIILPPQ